MTDDRHARYRAGLCTACGLKPHSPGRPRCVECHQHYATTGHDERTTT